MYRSKFNSVYMRVLLFYPGLKLKTYTSIYTRLNLYTIIYGRLESLLLIWSSSSQSLHRTRCVSGESPACFWNNWWKVQTLHFLVDCSTIAWLVGCKNYVSPFMCMLTTWVSYCGLLSYRRYYTAIDSDLLFMCFGSICRLSAYHLYMPYLGVSK